jgi:hypothetical protein
MLILVINSGRATLKVDVIEFASAGSGPRRLAQARFEQVGCTASCPLSASAGRALEETRAVPEHAATYALRVNWWNDTTSPTTVSRAWLTSPCCVAAPN